MAVQNKIQAHSYSLKKFNSKPAAKTNGKLFMLNFQDKKNFLREMHCTKCLVLSFFCYV